MDRALLAREAQEFAGRLSNLLNRTICNGPTIGAASAPGKHLAYVGHGVGHGSLSAVPLPLFACRSSGNDLYAVLSYTLTEDTQGEHLTVLSSVLGLCLDRDGERVLFHADYERNKKHGYLESHLQIHADSNDWTRLMDGTADPRPLADLHLPAGGRRYRATVEDLIEFVIAERLVKPRDGWKDVVAEHREDFETRQLRAAVRRNPEVARAELEVYDAKRKT